MTENNYIRKACKADICRLAELEIFNYRMNFYPIFRSDYYYFKELQVSSLVTRYESEVGILEHTYVYDDGVVKGMLCVTDGVIGRFFVEPVLQSQGIGSKLLNFALEHCGAHCLWVLEKNSRAIAFYERHGFRLTSEKIPEEGTTEYLVKMER